MASKRITRSSVNWAAIAERVPRAHQGSYKAFKSKSDGYLRRMLALPAEPPRIDWSAYRSEITVPGLVDGFEKSYRAMKIPYPVDEHYPAIDEYERDAVRDVRQFRAESEAIIKKAERRIEEVENMLPFGQMTLEDAAYVEPDMVLDLENRPSFWPHQEADRIFDEPGDETPPAGEQKSN